ncbi:MAG TPA: extracellular solute-binding protein [Alphaproteobacteria bacterium]|jgi:microcin C transport system substrate-binding protein|nr:extracellular solute-binding protein [Alphaproteobacteria bacterium]MDP7427523.1 extracellular solute-binding protein [Alphaproteobacteria bacterium]HJM52082.1 extracellular solute-binding protein [Alphaproteobacteria bacterium]
MRALGVAITLLLLAAPVMAQETTVTHGTSLLGSLKYPAGFAHFDYVDPQAPKGGLVRLATVGAFDSLHPYVLKGRAAAGLGLTFETLLTPSADESESFYGLIAESIEMPADRSWVAFKLRPEARFHDGSPITVEDVIFSFEMLKTKGHPFYRGYYADIAKAEKAGPRQVRFHFSGGLNRELPAITGQLPVLSKTYFADKDFAKTTLEPILGSGPYRVEAVDPGRSITYQRVADYWGRDLPVNLGQHNFDRLRYDYYRDQTVALEAFKAHAYDYRAENSSKRWATGYASPARDKGLLRQATLPDASPAGMQGFVFNMRRGKFRDRRVRQAISYAFDFEWSNRTLFHGQYKRMRSFFENSELAATGRPGPAELELLEPWRGKIPDEIFAQEYQPPKSDGSGNNRRGLRAAKKLLDQAGWKVKEGKLRDPQSGQALEFEILLVQPSFERIVLPMSQFLKRLGITLHTRTVDSAQYQNRVDRFDFDMITMRVGQSLSPGNEQRDFWHSEFADVEGSRNVIGIKHPAVDALVEAIIAAPDRPSLVAASRALDRVLQWNYYVIPQFYLDAFRIVYWDRFGRPARQPDYAVGFSTWWIDAEKDARIKAGEAAVKE